MTADEPRTLADLLALQVRDALDASGRTQADLARQVGVSEKHLSLVLNGKAAASVAVWGNLIAATRPDAAVVRAAQADEGHPSATQVDETTMLPTYCPAHGDLLVGPRSARCADAPSGHELAAARAEVATLRAAQPGREQVARALHTHIPRVDEHGYETDEGCVCGHRYPPAQVGVDHVSDHQADAVLALFLQDQP